jgi:pSer/pThr/pTyr-binding forkhead associated (FHA) protein
MSGPVVLGFRLLITIVLYVFLAWAFISLWRDIKLQAALLASRIVPPISLTITSNKFATQVRHFVQHEITIGRDPACECPVEDAAISTRHARLSYHQNQWWLEDLDSTNGTFLNNEKLDMPTVIISEDEFKCGDVIFAISLADDFLISPTKKPDSFFKLSVALNIGTMRFY